MRRLAQIGAATAAMACVLQPDPAALARSAAGAPAVQDATALVWTKPDTFWYRKALPDGHVWINVDALHGVKEPLFDHQRLAIELNLRTGYEFTPLTLPFADPAAKFVVKYDGFNAYIQEGAMAVEFVLDGAPWRCELQVKWDWNKVPPTDYECLPRRAGFVGKPATSWVSGQRTSPDGRWEARVDGHNVVVGPASGAGQTIPLSTDGADGFAYHSGSIRWSDDATVHAYRVSSRVWQSDGVSGSVKTLVVKGEWKLPAGR
jgi:hypothetical protein